MAFFQSLKHNFIAYHSSKESSRPDCIFEIHQLWQSGFSKVYSNCCCRCSFEAEIIKFGQSSHKMYSNNILNFQESTTILNDCTKKNLETYWIHHVHCSTLSIRHLDEVGHNAAAKATKNIYCPKDEDTVDPNNSRNFARVTRISTIRQGWVDMKLNCKAMPQAIEANRHTSTITN